ncbi:MAG: ATP-binding cassette domain-containing protein [Anaerolineae bacterium]
MTPYAIETSLLTRHFGKVMAVDRVDVRVPERSVYGFLGPNGAGKTTTIRLLLGLIKPDYGDVRIFERSMRQQRLSVLSRVGALVESPSLYPHLTGRENLEVTRRLIGAWPEQIDRVLEIVRLEKDANRLVRGYSMGMRQRLGIALALLNEPDLLILDEPTNGLDPAGIIEMRDLISRLPHDTNTTVFLSSHLLNEVEQVATHIGIINEGRMLFQGTLDELHAQRRETVSLGVNRPEEATQALTQLGWSVHHNGNRYLHIPVKRRDEPARLNAQLVGLGFEVDHLSLDLPSLEEIFLELTNGR